jgi:hypothetical protein
MRTHRITLHGDQLAVVTGPGFSLPGTCFPRADLASAFRTQML